MTVGLLVLALLAGIWPIAGNAATWFPVIAIPAAAGLPSLWPPLQVWPFGLSTVDFWIADTVGVAVMVLTAFLLLRRPTKKPGGSFRVFLRAFGATIAAMIAGNLIRVVHLSFAAHADFGTYLGDIMATIVVTTIFALVPAIVLGIIAALARPRA